MTSDTADLLQQRPLIGCRRDHARTWACQLPLRFPSIGSHDVMWGRVTLRVVATVGDSKCWRDGSAEIGEIHVEATPTNRLQEVDSARTMIDRVEARFEIKPEHLVGDTSYGTAALRVQDVYYAGEAARRAIVIQQKTKRPVQFEISEQTRVAVASWIHYKRLSPEDYLFRSRIESSPHLWVANS